MKAVWSERMGERPPKTHDLVHLAERLPLSLAERQYEYLRLVSEQYVPARYPDVNPIEPPQLTSAYVNQAQEFYTWLRQQLN